MANNTQIKQCFIVLNLCHFAVSAPFQNQTDLFEEPRSTLAERREPAAQLPLPDVGDADSGVDLVRSGISGQMNAAVYDQC